MSKRNTAPGASDCLVNLIIALLAPMFLWSCKGDVALARAAAAETLNAYCAADNLTLIRAAKVLALDLAALSSISLSMFDDASASLALRLRGNAVSLDRSAERNRAALEQERRDAAFVAQMADVTEEDLMASVQKAQRLVREAQARTQPNRTPPAPQPAQTPPAPQSAPTRPAPQSAPTRPAPQSAPTRPAPQQARPRSEPQPAPTVPTGAPAVAAAPAPISEQQRKTAWAGAMAEVAAEMAAGLHGLSPAERAADLMRIEALAQTATALSSGTALPPYLAASSVAVPARG